MAAALHRQIFLAFTALLQCSGQFYTSHYDHTNDDIHDFNWCLSAIRGNCICSDFAVDCSNQDLSWVPNGIPAATKYLFLNNNKIKAIEAFKLISLSSLEVLDLNSNDLQTLPADIFDLLPSLRKINLANNNWNCNCSLKWLHTWLLTAEANGLTVVDRSSTVCIQNPSVSMLDLSPADFLPCEVPFLRVERAASNSPLNYSFPNWTSVCNKWFRQDDCTNGPPEAASCVFSPDTRLAAIVWYRVFTSQRDLGACRDFCFSQAFSYFAYQNSTVNCLCGQECTTLSCSDCTSDTISSTALTLCGDRYMRIPLSLHMLSDIILARSSPVAVHTPMTITCTGYPSLVSSFVWNFGDGTTVNSTAGNIKHVYMYPGLFPVTLTLCGSGQCMRVAVRVKVYGRGQNRLSCPAVGDTSKKVDVMTNMSLGFPGEVRWSRTSTLGVRVYAGACENGWTEFQDVCIKLETNTKQDFQQAKAACQNVGASLLTFHHLNQIQELLQSVTFPSEGCFLGAEYDGSEYKWVTTNAIATVFKALNLTQTDGNCLAISSSDILGVSCSLPRGYICQKVPIPCPDGIQLGSRNHCFYTSSNKQTWFAARGKCQSQYSGDLAMLTDKNFSSLLTSSLPLTSTSWIGLSAPDLLGHYMWVDESMLTSDGGLNSNWRSAGVQWPCVAITATGQWEATDCNQQLPYICEYTLNAVVQTDTYVAGAADQSTSIVSVQELSERTALSPSSGLISVIFPGVWFARAGELYEVNTQLEPYMSDTVLNIMVLRPSCPQGRKLIRPGCGSSIFARCGSASDESRCPALPTCSSSDVPCPLSNTCVNSSVTCSCVDVTPLSADCSDTDLDNELLFKVVGQAVFDVPAAGGTVSARLNTRIDVQPYDIIGFQSSGPSGFLSCKRDSHPYQQQIMFKKGNTSALPTAGVINQSLFKKVEEQVCYVIAVYGVATTISIPDYVGFAPDANTYTFTAEVVAFPSLTASCSVSMEQDVGAVTWLYPSPIQAAPSPIIYVEDGVLETYLIMVSSGSNLELTWSLSTGKSYQGNFTSLCPSTLSALPPQCQKPISQLPSPFAFLQLAFPLSKPVALTVNIANALVQRTVTVSVNTVVRIENLVVYHQSCANHTACSPVLEAGLMHQFFCELSAGLVDKYDFKVNETQISVSPAPNMSHVFGNPGMYVVAVRASNSLGTAEAFLLVTVKVRAQVQQEILHTASPTYIRVGIDHNFTLTANVQTNTELNITWQFGDGGSASSLLQLSSAALNISQNYSYWQVGSYVLQVSLVDAFGVIVSLQSNVTVLTPIKVLVILPPPVVAAGTSAEFYIVANTSGRVNAQLQDFGNISYAVTYGDRSSETKYSLQNSIMMQHTYTANGTFHAAVSVSNPISSSSSSATVVVQICPTSVKLSYNGPQNVSTELTFVAEVKEGSDLVYNFDFGNGSLIEQQTPTVKFTYLSAGVYVAMVNVSNDVCGVFDAESVIVMDADTLIIRRLVHNRCTAVGDLVEFVVDLVTVNVEAVTFEWTFGDKGVFTGQGNLSVQHRYDSVGNYTVTVNLSLASGISRSRSSVVCVQEPVENVTVTGPELVGFSKNSTATAWFLATPSHATALAFSWALNGTSLPAGGSNISIQVGREGAYNISVMAHNEVSQAVAWMKVRVQHVVEELVVKCLSCINKRFIAPGDLINLTCTYLGTDVNVTWRGGVQADKQGVFFWFIMNISGNTTVYVTASNLVSTLSTTFLLQVQQRISNLKLTPDGQHVTEGSTIQLTANHSDGTDLTYTWNCTGLSAQYTMVNTITQLFSTYGDYLCIVTAANNVSSIQANTSIAVLQEITSLGVQNLASGSTLYVPVKKLPSVQADCNSNFCVEFMWTVMDAQATVYTTSGSNLTYIFPSPGSYKLNLTASNAISSLTITITTEAMEEISNVQLKTNSSAVVAGSCVNLTAYIGAGSSPQYSWLIDRFPILAHAGHSSFPYSFGRNGTYVVAVNVSNQLNSKTSSVTIVVQDPVVSLSVLTSLNFSYPYVRQNQSLSFLGNLSQGTDPQFKWTITQPSSQILQVNEQVLQMTFSQLGMYEIRLNVSNLVSQDGQVFMVYVEREITSLILNMSQSVMTGLPVSFVALVDHLASPVSFEWTIDKRTMTTASVIESFPNAGVYEIKVVAYNNISMVTQVRSLIVQVPVSQVQVINCGDVLEAGVHTLLQGSAQGSNVSFSWLVQDPQHNISSSSANWTLAFPAAGFYPVTLVAQNAVSQGVAFCLKHVQMRITGVGISILHPPVDYIFTNQNVSFLVHGDHLEEVQFTWIFSGNLSVITSEPSLVMAFPAAQNLTLEVTVHNAISQMSANFTFTIKELQCDLPAVSPVGSGSRTVLRSAFVQFEVYIERKGCSRYLAVYAWQVYDVADCSQTLPSDHLRLASVDTSEPTLILPASQLPTSSDQFCLRFVMGYENTPVAEQVHYNLTVLSSPLKAVILGGSRRVVQGMKVIHLDASLSFNPDNPTNSSGMQYSWSCQEVTAVGGCFQSVTKSVSEHSMSSFTGGTYNISLTVSLATHAPASAFQTVDVVTSSPSVLEVGILCVSCSASGHYRISSSQHTALSAQCNNCSCPLQYSWSVYEDQNASPVSLDSRDTSTGTHAANLVVLRNTALKDNHSYIFTVTMECQDGSRSPGQASISLLPNLPPTGGQCTVAPTSISPLDVVVTACSGWLDPDNAEAVLLYEITVQCGGRSYLLYYGTHERESVYMAPWPGSGGNASQLVITVIDQDGASTEALRVWIIFKAPGTGGSNESQYLLSNASAMLPTLMKHGDLIPLLQYSLALTQMLNKVTHALSSEEAKAQVLTRAAIMLCLTASAPVSTVQQALQLANALRLLTEFSEEYPSSWQPAVLTSLQSIVDVLQTNVRPGLDREDFAFESILTAVYNLISSVSSEDKTSVSLQSLSDAFPGFLDLGSEFIAKLKSLEMSGSQHGPSQKMNVVMQSFSLARSMTVVVLRSMVLDESSVTLELGGAQVIGSRSTVGSLGRYIKQGSCSFILPDDIFSRLSKTEEILEVVIMLENNPFTWGYWNDLSITTSVPSLSFSYSDGSDLAVSNLPTDIKIIMSENSVKNYSISNGSIINSEGYDPLSGLQFQTWTLESDASKKLVFNTQSGKSGVTALFMQVRIQSWSSISNISSQTSVKAFLGSGFEASSDKHTELKEITESDMAPGMDHRHYTFFISEQDFDSSKEYSITIVNQDKERAINVSSAMYFVSCQYFNEAGSRWVTDGCSASTESIPSAAVCNCNHLTIFGGSSLVPLSSIRFTDLTKLKLGLNPVALAALSTILVLYIALVIACRYLDQADLRRISMVPLCGKDGLFKYYITVRTGRQIGAGTTAHVGIKLYGEYGKSEARHLIKPSAFQRSSRDDFFIATDKELGRLHKVRLWHDNAGSSPSWYVDRLHVHDLQHDTRYVFPAHTWLSLEMEKGKLQKEIQAAGPEELHSFSHVFRTSLSSSWAERHMWLSIVEHPDHSRFTRVQRATCCVTLIYLYMFVSAMWYGLLKDQKEAALPFSWQAFGWEDVVISLVSVAITFPIGLGLTLIFKRSRLQPSMFQQVQRPQSAQTLEIEAMCDMSLYGGSLRTATPNEDWVTFFERESTAESIPPISSQLRRTTTVNPSKREPHASSSGAFPGSTKRSLVGMFQRTHELMWNRENILKSWPEKLPSFAEEESILSPKASTSSSKTVCPAQKSTPSAQKQAAQTTSSPVTRKVKTTTSQKKPGQDKADAAVDSDEEFMQRLEEIDRELQKSSHKTKWTKRGSQISGSSGSRKSSTQTGVEDLFDSGDEWTCEDVGPAVKKKGSVDSGATNTSSSSSSVSHKEQQAAAVDRRASLTSLVQLRAASMHIPSTAGGSTRDKSFIHRDSVFMHRDSIMRSFLLAGKSRTTLSAMLKHHMQVLSGNSEDEGCRLPSAFVYVGYAACVVMSVISIIMVLLYGYNFGPAVAAKWLFSVFVTFLISAFVLEPVKVVALALYAAVVIKDAEKDLEADGIDIQPRVEANEQIKEVKFRPIGGFALLQAQEEGKKVRRMKSMLRQATVYLLLTATLLAVAYLYFGSAVYLSGNYIQNSVVHPSNAAESLYDIKTTDMFWDWACQVLTPLLHRQEVAINEESPVLLGPARLRQIRSTLVDCLKIETRKCVGRLMFLEDTAAYSSKWHASGNISWIYSSADELKTGAKFGHDLLYPGGGYVQVLGTTFNQTLKKLENLRDSNWLDRRSRALFIEWTAYSVASDLTSCVTLLLEFPISGGTLASHSISTHRLLAFFKERFDPLYVCQVLLLLTGLCLLYHAVHGVIQQRMRYVCSLDNWLELMCTLTCLASIGLYVACVIKATDTINSPSSFTSFERVVHLHEVLRCMHASLLFLLFLKFAGQVKFIRPLHVYVLTLSTASGKLAGAAFIFLVLLLVYTQLGYLFFGSFVQGYRSFQSTLLTLFGIMRGSMDLTAVLEFRPVFSHFFFYSFYAFVYGVFVALVLAVLQDSYRVARSHMYFKSSLEPQDYEMVEFMLRRFKLWAGFIKPKPAFRHVKFEGLPSLPSRSTSSAASSQRPVSQMSRELTCLTHEPVPPTADILDNLLPRWEKLLTLFSTVELLEKQEQQQIGKVQAAVTRWCSQHKQTCKKDARGKAKKVAGGGTGGSSQDPSQKPPVDPSSKFIRFRNNFQRGQENKSDSSGSMSSTLSTLRRKSFNPPSSMSKPPGETQQETARPVNDQHGHSAVPSLPGRSLSDSHAVKPGVHSAVKSNSQNPAGVQQSGSTLNESSLSASSVGTSPSKALGRGEGEATHKQPLIKQTASTSLASRARTKAGVSLSVREPPSLSAEISADVAMKKKAWET